MSGLKTLKEHVRAVKNIKKITTSMKSVAASKFLKSEKTLRGARPLGVASLQFYETSKVRAEVQSSVMTFVAVTSDRGLCGSMHAKVCRYVRIRSFLYPNRFDVVCIGEKAKAILLFEVRRSISLVVNGIGHGAPTFTEAGRIVRRTVSKVGFSAGTIVFCKFRNMMSFEVNSLPMYSVNILASCLSMLRYELEADEELVSYVEFSQVILMYYALCETFLVELSSRITAMSNASKNAGKVSQKLTLEMNRRRQHSVTTELMDIVSGASVISSQ